MRRIVPTFAVCLLLARSAAADEPPPAAQAPAPPAGEAAAPMAAREYPLVVERERSRFEFGSYGRVMAATDGRGRRGRNADLVAWGSRLDEDSYAELEFRREDTYHQPSGTLRSRIVSTVAFGEPLFHESGEFSAKVAVRNLYLDIRGIADGNVAVWAGSRMVRGDDAYLLNFWPLDNLNLVGGGARWKTEKSELSYAIGMNRLNDPFQYQTSPRPLPGNQVGTTDVAILDRTRVVQALRYEKLLPVDGKLHLKVVGYAEAHNVGSGQRETAPGQYEDMPRDFGWVVGAQVGLFSWGKDDHVNLFLRQAKDLAAYGGDFARPFALNQRRTTKGARETRIALSGNLELGSFALMGAAYFRMFRTASEEPMQYLDLDEGILLVRPHYWFLDTAGVFVEGSYQVQRRGVISADGQTPLTGTMWRFGVAPFLSPAGRGSYKRPQLRLIALLSGRNGDAKAMYPRDDPFARRSTEQFFGIEAEWWFNSSYR